MASATRKRTSAKRRSATTDQSSDHPTAQAANDPTPITNGDPSSALTSAYWQALESRDETTGTIDAVHLDSVRVAYVETPKRKRGDMATALTNEALQKMVAAGTPDPAMAQAIGAMSGLFAEVNENGGRPPAPPHDPVSSVAGVLHALEKGRTELLAGLDDDQRQRVAEVDPETDETALEIANATLTALQKYVNRALNGRTRRAPVRSGKDLGEVIRNTVADSDGPVTLSDIAKANGIKASGLWSRWTADKTPGVKPVYDDNGHKAFVAA